MLSDIIIGVFAGAVGTILLSGTIFLIGFAIWYTVNKDYRYRIRIRNMSGGKDVIEWVKAKKIKHEKLGEAYYMPTLKSQNRALAPVLGSEFEFPMGKKTYVALTFYSGQYAPEKFDPTSEEITREVLEFDEKTGKYEKVVKTIKVFVLRPVPQSIRKWVIDADRAAADENPLKLSWFERNKEFIAIVVIAILTAVVCFMILLFSFQYGTTVITQPQVTPQWAIDLLNYTITNSTGVPPTMG